MLFVKGPSYTQWHAGERERDRQTDRERRDIKKKEVHKTATEMSAIKAAEYVEKTTANNAILTTKLLFLRSSAWLSGLRWEVYKIVHFEHFQITGLNKKTKVDSRPCHSDNSKRISMIIAGTLEVWFEARDENSNQLCVLTSSLLLHSQHGLIFSFKPLFYPGFMTKGHLRPSTWHRKNVKLSRIDFQTCDAADVPSHHHMADCKT